jgi:hypothetical protein
MDIADKSAAFRESETDIAQSSGLYEHERKNEVNRKPDGCSAKEYPHEQ